MNKQKFALYALLNLTKLSKEEISNLTLADLHLSGASPHLKITSEKGDARTVELDETTKNALVVWLVARPDQPSSVLFPDETGEMLSSAKIDALLENYDAPPLPDTGKKSLGEDILIAEKLPAIPSKKAPAPPPFSVARPAVSPERITVSPPPRMGNLPISQGEQTITLRPKWSGIIIGGLALIACIGLVWIGAVFMKGRSERDEQALMGNAPTVAAIEASPTIENTVEPTMAPSDTPTPKPTDTPAPATTATHTPLPPATDTPTAIPSPTDTIAPPTATLTPTDAPTTAPAAVSHPTPTLGLKYAAPVLLSPEKDAYFIGGYLIDLKWESVGNLAGNEQYAVRVVYKHNTKLVYRGEGLKNVVWRVPNGFYRDADGPNFDYEWYVYIEEIQPDGTGIPVSPESEHRHFKWE